VLLRSCCGRWRRGARQGSEERWHGPGARDSAAGGFRARRRASPARRPKRDARSSRRTARMETQPLHVSS
jgi:hypothetical protein